VYYQVEWSELKDQELASALKRFDSIADGLNCSCKLGSGMAPACSDAAADDSTQPAANCLYLGEFWHQHHCVEK
jgi:hypothetical protein